MDKKSKERMREEVTTDVIQRLAAPSTAPKKFPHRLLDFAEQPLFTTSVGIVGSLVGLFYPPVFLLCGLCVVLAFHRAKVVSGNSLLVQIPAYVLVTVVIVALLWRAHTFIDAKLAESSTSLAQLVTDSVKKILPSSMSSSTTTDTPKSTDKPKSTAPAKSREPEPTLKSLMEGWLPNDARVFATPDVGFGDGFRLKIEDVLYLDFPGGSKCTGFYIPTSPRTYDLAMALAPNARKLSDDLVAQFKLTGKSPGENPQSVDSLVHTGRVFLYHDDFMTKRQEADVEEAFAKQKLEVVLRGSDYLTNALVEWSRRNGESEMGATSNDKLARLSSYILKGERLREQFQGSLCDANYKGKSREVVGTQIQKWHRDLNSYVRNNLGNIYAARLRNQTPPPTSWPCAFDRNYVEAYPTWNSLFSDLQRLGEFVKELQNGTKATRIQRRQGSPRRV